MNKLTLIQLLNVANIPFLSYTDKVVFVVEDELHECFLDENDCVAAEETWSDGCTLSKKLGGMIYEMYRLLLLLEGRG